MAKIFDFAKAYPDSQAIAVPDVTWFRKNQKFLLWMANWSQEGQKLLKMEQTPLERIDEIWPNRVSQYNLDGSITTDFRVGCKWTNLINFQWEWMQEMAKQFQAIEAGRLMTNEWNVPVFGFQPALGATGSYYPEAGGGGGNVTCDGVVYRISSNSSWSSLMTGNGTGADVTNSTTAYHMCEQSSSSNGLYNANYRMLMTINCTTIEASSTINSATLYLFHSYKQNGLNSTINLGIMESAQATNNTVVSSDYQATTSNQLSDTSIAYSSVTVGQYNGFAFNSYGKSVIANKVVKISPRDLYGDVGNNAPGTWYSNGTSRVNYYPADYSGTSSDPYLLVDYTTSSTFTPRTTSIIS